MELKHKLGAVGPAVLGVAMVLTGCGGSGDDGNGTGMQPAVGRTASTVAVSGTVMDADGGGSAQVSATASGRFRIRATGASGSIHETEADDRGRFAMMLPPNETYVMGFEHFDTNGGKHFAGHMVFGCGGGETDQFFVGGREERIDLGTVTVRRDGSFARPSRNPLEQVDRDGDGMSDARDAEMQCAALSDRTHDGYYDTDMNRDGHHDGAIDANAGPCSMGGRMHDDGPGERCAGAEMAPTPRLHGGTDHNDPSSCSMDQMMGTEDRGTCHGPGMTQVPTRTATPDGTALPDPHHTAAQ